MFPKSRLFYIAYKLSGLVFLASLDKGCHLFQLSVCFRGGSVLWITD